MARIKIDLPSYFRFTTYIPVRITDLNFGGHVGNDSILSILHEARVQFLNSLGYSEMNFAGAGLIMADVAIQFKGESFYGDVLEAKVTPVDIHKYGFDLVYSLTEKNKAMSIAYAKTGMLCFDYAQRKISLLPETVKAAFETIPA